MKHFILLIIILLAVFSVLSFKIEAVTKEILLDEITIGTNQQYVWHKMKFYLKLSKLADKPPDERILMPVEGIHVSQIEDTWEAARSDGRTHEGQDIFAPRSTPVYSATDGYIISIDQKNLGGNIIYIFGSGGRRYYYAHLDSIAPNIAERDHVTTDTLLGFVGNSGNAENTPYHLHFGVYTSFGAINPLPLLENRH